MASIRSDHGRLFLDFRWKGIRFSDYADALALLEAGADLLGTSSTEAILRDAAREAAREAA